VLASGELSPLYLGPILGTVSTEVGRFVNGDPTAAVLADQLCRTAADLTGQIVRRAVHLVREPAEVIAPIVAVHCTFTSKIERQKVVLQLDEDAVRAVVTPLLADHLAVHGAGPLLDAERGVFDYAVNAWLDAFSRTLADTGMTLTLQRVDHDPQRRREPDGKCAACRLSVGSAEGRVKLLFPSDFQPRWAAVLVNGQADPTSDLLETICTLRVALGAVDVDSHDIEALETGDVLLLGRTSLTHLSAEATLCSDSGWTLGRAQVRHDSDATLSVELLDVDPAPQAQSVLYVLLGRLALTGKQVQSLRAGSVLDLARDRSGDACIRFGGRDIGCGELVTACGEIGVRITAVSDGVLLP
jgi:flagellar motor switch/type III secretory pathway protein FliN